MSAPAEDPREALARVVKVLAEDADLRAWFHEMARQPDAARAHSLHTLAHRMHAAGEHPELVRATALLAQPEVFRAVEAALGEL